MERYAASDADWLARTFGDRLAREEALAERPRAVRFLLRGFNTRQQVDMPPHEIDQTMDELVAMNANVHRLMVYWADVQPGSAREWRWHEYDAVVASAAARGLRLILTPTGSPNWARSASRRTDPSDTFHPFPHPDDLQAWSVFVRALARRYARHAYAFEIWNEPNLRFWEPRQLWLVRGPSPSGWKELYCRAAKEIEAAAPLALIGSGGLAPVAAHGWNWPAGKFLKRAFAVGLARCGLDFVAYHAYLADYYCNGRNPPLDGTLAPLRELARVRGVMIAKGFAGRQVWNTESGFPSRTCGYTDERQADLIGRLHTYLSSLPYVSYSLAFNPRDDPSGTRYGYLGVFRLDWSPKPSVETFGLFP